MNGFVDVVMLTLFVLFMVFIFGGYHKNKSAAREADRELEETSLDSSAENSKVK